MQKNIKTFIAVTISLVVVIGFFWFGLSGMFSSADTATEGAGQPATVGLPLSESSVTPDAFRTEASGLQIADFRVGTGEEIVVGQTIAVHYVGTFVDGTQFDSSVDRAQPLVFVFGTQQVISGMDAGLAGMRVGGIRRIIIPPELAYGANVVKGPDGEYVIPPQTALVFDVQLMGISK